MHEAGLTHVSGWPLQSDLQCHYIVAGLSARRVKKRDRSAARVFAHVQDRGINGLHRGHHATDAIDPEWA